MYRTVRRLHRAGHRLLPLAVGLTISLTAGANPQGLDVRHGSVSLAHPNAQTLEITNSPGAILNWQGFSIDRGETTRFIQQNAASTVLNRVTGGDPSAILGNLLSNGRVFLLNPTGILIGPEAMVDTAGLVMSTLQMSDADFLRGELRFEGDSTSGTLVNQGYIKTAPGGEIILIAPQIVNEPVAGYPNSGLIESPDGELVLAAGYAITIASLDHPDITFEVRAPDNEVVNLGRLLAAGGSVEVLAGTIRHSGEINADSMTRDDAGRIVLAATDTVYLDAGSSVSANNTGIGGYIEISAGGSPDQGRIYALGHVGADGADGGDIKLDADRILVAGTLSAEGDDSGGDIDVRSSIETIATASARFDAGGDAGAGGSVRIDDGDNVFSSAQVDVRGEQGGRVEVLGDTVTLAAGVIDASGQQGGGAVRIGGGFQGGEGLAAATNTTVSASTVVKADAVGAGDGGSVVVWADGATQFAGVISARGGATAGDGGTVEVSGKAGLGYAGQVDVTADNGAHGTLLLDPKDIIFSEESDLGAGSIALLDPHPGQDNNFGNTVSSFFENGDFSTPAKFAVFDPEDDFGGLDAGAVYLYRASDGALLSALTGDSNNDQVGSFTLQFVNGEYFLRNPQWRNNTGAITRFDVVNGINGTVGSSNSLVGAMAGDQVGSGGLQTLGSHIAVRSPLFNANAGAVTVRLPQAITGVVGAGNSLVGANAGDLVGLNAFQSLFNGNFILRSDHGGAGAVTFVNPGAAPTGVVSATNSLVGTLATDDVGGFGVSVLGTHYSVRSPNWNNDTGAFTLASTTTGLSGAVGAGNSLVGTAPGDFVGNSAPQNLFTGRYALVSDIGTSGAVTVFTPASMPVGVVAAGNSLIGNPGDEIGSGGLNFVAGSTWAVLSPSWDAPAANAGAVTTLDASTGTFDGTATPFAGLVSATNSLVGVTASDGVGSSGIQFIAGTLSAVRSPGFDNTGAAASDAGALTWITPGVALAGAVGAGNSLIGAFTDDDVGGFSNFTQSLFNGNVVISIPDFNSNAGAVVFVDGAAPPLGQLGAANALVGSTANDDIGSGGIELWGSSYVVLSPNWDNGPANVGAMTVGSVTTGIVGAVGAGNSLIGLNAGDAVGSGGTIDLFNGNALLYSPAFDGTAGAVTYLDFNSGNLLGDTDFVASVDNSNSLVGASAGEAAGSGGIEVLGNHYVVLSPDAGPSISMDGAVTVVDSATGLAGFIDNTNSLVGSNGGDRIGSNGLAELSSGNALVFSPNWNGNAGAVTFLDLLGGNLIGDVDFVATLDATNSLVGSTANDNLASDGDFEFFAGGNEYYAIFSSNFDNGLADTGAVTFADSLIGVAGTINNTNSFVGVNAGDNIGAGGFTTLSNGNVVLLNPQALTSFGAVTFVDLVNGAGLSGDIDATTSLVGAFAGDNVGSGGVSEIFGTDLYVVDSPLRGDGAINQSGALSWGNVDTGLVGTLNAGNSLLGSTMGDDPGSGGVFFVFSASGSRVMVESPNWDNGGATDAGAITTFLASSPTVGVIGAGNSLVGSNTNDRVGDGARRFLSNGNQLLVTSTWNNNRGAVTFWDTGTNIVGTVGAGNSLVGASDNDRVGDFFGFGVTETSGGQYYVASPDFNSGAGAITFASIATGRAGVVSATNSLIGGSAGDGIGNSITNLSFSDKLLLASENWNAARGAVTVIDPAAAPVGLVSASNSLVGSSAGDRVGDIVQQLFATDNRGLVVLRTSSWDSMAGAVTLIDPDAGPVVGTVGAGNSLVGRAGDQVGNFGVNELSNGTLLVSSPNWSDGAGMNFGAVTIMVAASAVTPVTGFVSAENSLVGSHLNDQISASALSTLSSGNILLRNSQWFDNRGAVTFVNVTEGRAGVISNVNSLVGNLPDDFLGSGGVTTLGNDRALVRSPLASINGIAGAGRLDIIDGATVQSISGNVGFGTNPGSELLVSISSVVDFLNSGATLLLQANNDIFLPAGGGIVASSGALFLEAGRSIDLEADLIVLDGEISLLGNSPNADSAFRDAGDGTIRLTAAAQGVRIEADIVALEAQNILLRGGEAPGAHAAVIGHQSVEVHAHGSGLLELTAGTAPGTGLPDGTSEEILQALIADPGSVTAPVAVLVGGTEPGGGVSVLADDVNIRGGGSTGAFAAIASFGGLEVETINLTLAAGAADNSDALILGLGGVADVEFSNCVGCNEQLFDPLLDSAPQSGIFISGILTEPTLDAILAMSDREKEDEDDEEDDEEDETGLCN